ncbi:MAG: BatA domain-containing protein [Pirellulales bacterium]
MTFLNFILLGGSAAMFAPLIIHLLNRSRFRTVDWGAMHLLESALKINSRRIQWRALLLLMLRMLIPALLALCLARPVLTAWRTAGTGPSSVVLVIDNSLSMEAAAESPSSSSAASSDKRSSAGASVFDAAVAAASELIRESGSATELSIIAAGGGPVNQASGASFDTKRALQRVSSIEPGAGSVPWVDTLAEGLAQLDRSQQLRRRLIVLSDFQQSEWERIPTDALSALHPADSETRPTEITFIPIAAKNRENLSIHIDTSAGSTVTAKGQTLEVRAVVRNHGETKVSGVPVVFAVDDTTLASKNVDVGGKSQVYLVFKCMLDAVGSHVIRLSMDETAARAAAGETPASVIRTDDTALWSVDVIEPIEAVIVDALGPDSQELRDSIFLQFALAPYAVSVASAAVEETTAGLAEATAGIDPIRCRLIEPKNLDQRELNQLQVVALADIKQLDNQTAQRLTDFVTAGGTLMLFPGASSDIEWLNKTWGVTAKVPLLAHDFDRQETVKGTDRKELKIAVETFNHPALALFNRSSNGRLDTVDFNTWFQIKPREPAKSDGADAVKDANKESSATQKFSTLLSLENGDPLLMERIVGRGRVLQWTVSCGDKWSNLPLREVVVPLMQQLVMQSAVSGSPRLNLETGSTLTVTAHKKEAAASASKDKEKLKPIAEVLAATKAKYRLELGEADDRYAANFERTQFPGVYAVSGVRSDALQYTVSAPDSESDPTPLDDVQLETIAQRLGAEIHRSVSDYREAEQIKLTGREVFRWLLIGLVIALFVELFLQQSLTRPSP